MLFYIQIFYPIYNYDARRTEFAKYQSGSNIKEIIICELPNKAYIHVHSPQNAPWIERYKLFYNLEEDVHFKFVTFSEFNSIYEQYR